MNAALDPHRYENPVPVRVVRKIPNDGPVMDISSTDIACNQGGNVGTNKTFDVNAGSDMTFQWTSVCPPWPQFSDYHLTHVINTQQWPADHKGPVTTFMASCNGDCSSFTASNGKWFKIDQGGYTNGQWASDKLIASTSDCFRCFESCINLLFRDADGNKWTTNIPAGLASGQYVSQFCLICVWTRQG